MDRILNIHLDLLAFDVEKKKVSHKRCHLMRLLPGGRHSMLYMENVRSVQLQQFKNSPGTLKMNNNFNGYPIPCVLHKDNYNNQLAAKWSIK